MSRRARSSTDLNRQQRSCLNFFRDRFFENSKFFSVYHSDWMEYLHEICDFFRFFCLYFQTHFEESSILLNNSNFAEVSLSPFYPVSVLKLPFLHFYSRPNIGSKPHIRSKIRIQIYDQHIYEPPDFLSYMVDHQIYVTAKALQETKYFLRCSYKSDAFIVFSQRHIFFKYSMLPRSFFTSVQRSFVGKSKEGRAKEKKLKKKKLLQAGLLVEYQQERCQGNYLLELVQLGQVHRLTQSVIASIIFLPILPMSSLPWCENFSVHIDLMLTFATIKLPPKRKK